MLDIDFSQCKMSAGSYAGASGKKKGIIYNGESYMLKFSQNVKEQGLEIDYSNSSINEYIACHIFESLGIKTQETLLGKFDDKIVVACKDFTTNGYMLRNFYSLKNSVLSDESKPEDTELSSILKVFDEQTQFPQISTSALKKFFWEMFIVDALLANTDRHNGNWGFLTNLQTNNVQFAPIYDCGSCLFPLSATDESFKRDLNNVNSIIFKTKELPLSVFRIKREKINYYDFLAKDCYDRDCLNALVNITERIDIKAVSKIIDETPYISDLNKEFLNAVVLSRKENLLEKAIFENKNISKLYAMDSTPKSHKDFAGFEYENTSALNAIKSEELGKQQAHTQTLSEGAEQVGEIAETKNDNKPKGPRQ